MNQTIDCDSYRFLSLKTNLQMKLLYHVTLRKWNIKEWHFLILF